MRKTLICCNNIILWYYNTRYLKEVVKNGFWSNTVLGFIKNACANIKMSVSNNHNYYILKNINMKFKIAFEYHSTCPVNSDSNASDYRPSGREFESPTAPVSVMIDLRHYVLLSFCLFKYKFI